VLLLAWQPAHGRHILDLDVNAQPAQLKDWGEYLMDEGAQATLQVVASQPERLSPSLDSPRYELRGDQALWIAFTVPATPDDQRWYVRLSQPGLDSVTLYTRGSDDTWTAGRAGDLMPVSSWALPHRYPVLPLTISAAEPTRYMLRIQSSDGLSAPVEFVSESWLTWEQQRMSLLYGGYFGLLVMGAVFALTTGWVLRDAAYAWLGIWTALAGLTASCAVGIAGLHIWPAAPAWSDAAHHVLPALTCVPFLFFVIQTLVLRERARGLFFGALALAAFAAVSAALAGWTPSPWRAVVAQGTVALTVFAAAAAATWAWYRGDTFARNLVFALAPLVLALPSHRVASLHGDAGTDLGLAMAVLLGGLALSTCACYLLLAWRDQNKRDHRRRLAQLHEADPATGLVNDLVFARRAQELVERAQRFGHHSVVAMVEFTNFGELRAEFGRRYSLELLLRLAERLTAMLRSIDTVARLGEHRFGVLIDGPVAASRARSLCAKIIACCVTPLAGLPLGLVVKPRIALALVPMHGEDMPALTGRLDGMLRDAAGDPSRVILIAGQVNTPPASPLWRHAPPAPRRVVQRADTVFQPTSAVDELD
jgi:diguanylate cyclase (GGDEF)-like protein